MGGVISLSLLLFISCEKDLYEDAITEQNRDYKIRMEEFEKVYADPIFQSSFSKITKNKLTASLTSRSALEENKGFTILDAPVKIIEKNGITTYTLLVERDQTVDGKLENLVLYSEPIAGEIGYIIKYNALKESGLTEKQIKDSGIDELVGVITDVNVSDKFMEVYFFVKHCIVGYGHPRYCGGDPSSPFFTTQCGHWESSFIYISEGGAGGSTSTPPENDGDYGPGSVGIGGATSPVGLSPKHLRKKDFDKKLPFNIEKWLHANETINSLITNYLESTIDSEIQNSYDEAVINAVKNFLLNTNLNWIALQTEQTQQSIFNYLIANNFSSSSVAFVEWMRNYLTNHPTVTWQQFENWFFTPREGQDYIYDSTYWENPSLTFPQQNLPMFQNFNTNYPRMNGEQLAQLVGGDVLNLYNQYPSVVRGFCALKVSRALNYSGVTIPNITTTNGNPGTVLGGDGKYYFLNAKALNKWMQKTFGVSPVNSNHIKILGSQGGENGGNFQTLTAGIKGIYSMVSSNLDWASGHADLINEGICVFGCHFYDNPPAPIDYIDIWILN